MIGEKLAVIEFHVARSGFGVAEGIKKKNFFVTASSFPEGGLRSGAPALAISTRTKTSKLKMPRIILITHWEQMLVRF